MNVTHATVPFRRWSDVAAWLESLGSSPFLHCADASTPMVAAAWLSSLNLPVRAWLEVDSDHTASLAARDIKTLSMLVPLEAVMISGPGTVASDAAELIAKLLGDDDVWAENSAGTLRGAWNRPRPPRPISLWVTSGIPADTAVVTRCAFDGRETIVESTQDSQRVDLAT